MSVHFGRNGAGHSSFGKHGKYLPSAASVLPIPKAFWRIGVEVIAQ